MKNKLLLDAGMLACAVLFLLLVTTAVLLFFQAWWPALAVGALGVLLSACSYSTIALWVKMHRAILAYAENHLVEAEARLREAVHLVERLGRDDPRRGETLQWLAVVTRALGDYDSAEANAREALASKETAWGMSHPRTLFAVWQLAEVYLDIARYAEAEGLLQRSLVANMKAHDRYGEALDCSALARIHCEKRDYAHAESLAQHALTLLEEAGLRNAVERLGIVLRLAHVSACLHKLHPAEELTRDALKCAQARQPDSLEVGACLNELALIRYLQGRPAEAEAIQRRALAITEKIVGPNVPALAGGLNLLGAILTAQQKWPEAEECLMKALRLREEYLAPEHPAIAEVLGNLAELLFRTGRQQISLEHVHQAAQIRAAQLPHDVT